MKEQVFALAGRIAGVDEDGQALLEQLCEASVAMWESRLAEGVSAESCGSAFVCAAAFTAAADFCTARQSGGGVDFTAGEISVKTRAAGETAALADSLRQTAERLMTPYGAASGGFAFLGVRG